jgi:hypothetical protein
MRNFRGKVEIVANCSIIVVAILLSIFLIKHLRKPSEAVSNAKSAVERNDLMGKKLSLPDVEWGQSDSTLVLAIQSKCHFCTESAPFYKQLVNTQAARSSRQLIVISPESSEITKKYLDSLGVAISEIRQTNFTALGVAGTPTLFLIDKDGVVTTSWRGKLNSEREADVLARF